MAVSETPRRPRTRRPQLTREAVIEAAARVLEREGYAGLTMRAIADELGVQAPALYWYVGAKEELESLLYDQLMAGFTVTLAGDDWRENVCEAARALRRYLSSKRDISYIVPQIPSLGPNSSAQLDGALAILRAGGLSPRDAAYAFNLLFGYVVDWVAGEASWHLRQRTAVAANLTAAPDLSAYPNLADSSPYLASGDIDGQFEFGLSCMVSGLERRAAGED